MKKAFSFVVLIFTIFILAGCDLADLTFYKNTTAATGTTTTGTNVERKNMFEFNDCVSYKDVYKSISNGGKAFMPSTGDVKVLIIPIWFERNDMVKSEECLTKIEKTFFGSELDTGWESVKSYFAESSYGKLNYTGFVTDWYTPVKKASYYEATYRDGNHSTVLGQLLVEALRHFDDEIDYNDYDSDNDGIIDAVYLLYNTPVSMSVNDVWWAWQAYYSERGQKFDGLDVYQYTWAGIDFMNYDNNGVSAKGKLNASTYIHETTHLMGADDYYDYDANEYKTSGLFGTTRVSTGKGCNYGIGDFDMMDSNIGDHNPVTKMFLGWIDPYVITGGIETIDIEAFSKTGKTIVVCPSWQDSTNILNEFFVIDFYDNAGLDAYHEFNGLQFGVKGVRIYHVNAVVEKDDEYWSIFKYDNSYTDHAFLTLINAKGSITSDNDFIDSAYPATANSLFKKGQTFVPNNNKEYVDKNLLNISIKVNSITDEKANVTIEIE